MSTSKICVDLRQRTFTIEVPDERVEAVLARVEALFKTEPTAPDVPSFSEQGASEQAHNIEPANGSINSDVKPKVDVSTKKRGKVSTKVKSWTLVDLPLNSDQRQNIREFYKEKNPAGQNDQVATIGVKLKEFMQKTSFSGDEIHSAFKIVDLPTPKNLIAVFGNMKRDGRANYVDNQIVINSHTEDYVNYVMVGAKKEKSK